MRGLKLAFLVVHLSQKVAPLVGAWIETDWVTGLNPDYFVAPLVGAWIETVNRGQRPPAQAVAPLVGAWIET